MKKPNIVFVGHVVVDRNRVEQASYVRWGSPAMFMTKYFQSHSGLRPTIIASYGQDFVQYANGVKLLPAQPNLETSTVYENIVKTATARNIATTAMQHCQKLHPISKRLCAKLTYCFWRRSRRPTVPITWQSS